MEENDETVDRILELARECTTDILLLVEEYLLEPITPSHSLQMLGDKLNSLSKYNIDYEKYVTFYTAIRDDSIALLELYFIITQVNLNAIMDEVKDFTSQWNPLIYAINYNRKSIVKYFLDSGVDFVTKNALYENPIQCALTLKRTEILTLLLFHEYGITLTDPMEQIKFLLDKRDVYYNRKCKFSTLLYYAYPSKDAFILALSVSPIEDMYGLHPVNKDLLINLLVNYGNKGILKLAIDHGLDLNFDLRSVMIMNNLFADCFYIEPLYVAAAVTMHRSTKLVPFLIKNGANIHSDYASVDTNGRVKMFDLLGQKYCTKALKTFERCGVDVCKKLSPDENELHHWCRYAEYIEPFLLALERGTDINHLDHNNYTPLKFALEGDLLGRSNINLPFKFLVSILVKMQKNGEFVCDQNIDCLNDPKVESFRARCQEEIVRLKKEKFDNSSVTVYDFLTGDLQKLTSLAKNKKTREQFRRKKIKNEFPIYNQHLKRNFERSIWRFKEVEKIFKNSENCCFPPLIIEKICGYLSDKELRMSRLYFMLLKM